MTTYVLTEGQTQIEENTYTPEYSITPVEDYLTTEEDIEESLADSGLTVLAVGTYEELLLVATRLGINPAHHKTPVWYAVRYAL
jgi:hypothetical protein